MNQIKKIKHVFILGAGAMGAIYASKFFDTPGFTVHLAASGKRAKRLKQEGMIINGKHYQFSVTGPADTGKPETIHGRGAAVFSGGHRARLLNVIACQKAGISRPFLLLPVHQLHHLTGIDPRFLRHCQSFGFPVPTLFVLN